MLNEYRWVPLMYLGYAVSIIGVLILGMINPDFSDDTILLIITLMAVIYTGALTGLCVRSLKRIEQKLGTLGGESEKNAALTHR